MKKIGATLLLIGLLLSMHPVPNLSTGDAQLPRGDSPGRTHKVVASPDLFAGQEAGIVLLADYGSYALYRVSETALARVLSAGTGAQVRIVDEMDRLLIDAYPFNTQTETPSLPGLLQEDSPDGNALHLVQFIGPIKASWLDALRELGVIPIHYVAHNAYLVWSGPRGRDSLDAVLRAGSYLQYSAPYHPYYKLGPSILNRVLDGFSGSGKADELVTVDIQVYANQDHPAEASKASIKGLTVEQLAPWTPILHYQNAVLKVRSGDLEHLAMLPDVVWVGERFPRVKTDEVQGQILAGNFDPGQTGPSGTGYLAWLDGYGFSSDPDDYPVVDIVDDGVGNGTPDSGDPTLHQFGSAANPSRLAYVANCTSAPDGGGPDGHGHINVSIAGGYDTRSGSPYRDAEGYQRGLGTNPYGWLASTRVFGPSFDLSNCGGTDTGLLQQVQDNGAQIASSSWGCGYPYCTIYDASSQAFDVGVRDADGTEPGNQELVLLFSAGNDGPGSGTVGSPGNGKNVITVGASENDRPTWIDGCDVGPSQADHAMDIAGFSSRGPAPGSRVKPEVVAPGTHIQGTASTHPDYTGDGVCDRYMPTGQTVFAASSGTSHSTPAVAGVASLYYHWLEHTYAITPSPSLLKAYLVAHTTYLTGTYASDTLPSNNQGYGMPNMSAAFDDAPRYIVNQTTLFDNSGETWTWNGGVADPTKPVRIVLAYTDKAGLIGTSPQVNDLNLEATIAGTPYLGNNFTGRWSTSGGSPDAANNYEAIFLPPGTNGAISIVITAFNVADDGVPNVGDGTDQDFSLVCYNCLEFPDFYLSATPSEKSICAPQSAAYDITVGQILEFSDPVTLSAQGNPAGTTAAFTVNPVTPPGASQLTIDDTGGAAVGSYDIDIVGIAPTSTHTTTVRLGLFTAAPGPATLASPADGATGVSVQPTLEWTAPLQGDSYVLQVATDAAFSSLVYTATTTEVGHTLAVPLMYNSLYHWRVWTENACGIGAPSAVYSFTTGDVPPVYCSAPNLAIPDNTPTGVADTLPIVIPDTLLDLNVAVTVHHTYVGDLVLILEHQETGTSVTLIDRPGVPGGAYGCSGNDMEALLDDEAKSPVETECAPAVPTILGAFRPNDPLANFDGQSLSGTWKLTISDRASYDTGLLVEWCLIPTTDRSLSHKTYLPLILIRSPPH